MVNDYLGMKIMASVEYYEVDPKTGEIAHASGFSAVTKDYIKAPAPGEGPPVSVSFDFTTDTTGLVAAITVANADPVPSTVAAVLQVSQDGEGGWITSTRNDLVSLTDTDGTGAGSVDFDVDADADDTPGDGGGLHYRVVVTFGTGDDRTSQASDPIQLGDVTADPTSGATDIISGATPAVGETIRVNTGGEDAEVQWQVRDSETRPWMDIEEADELTLEVSNAQAGKMLRAKVTYMTNDDDPDTDADESTYPSWVEYTEVVTVSGDIDNNDPASTQSAYEIRVQLAPTTKVGQPAAIVSDDSIEDLFFDSDGNDLTYSITAVTPDLASVDGTDAGHDAELSAGDQVYRSYTTTIDSGNVLPETRADLQQTLAIDKSTGEITYFTDTSQAHDGNGEDGAGNTIVAMVSATDNMVGTTPATVAVTVRINVSPTAIQLDDNNADAANLPVWSRTEKGTALTDGTGDVTYMDDAENDAVKVADLNIMDQNSMTDDFGTHKITLSGRGANMFEVRETDDDDTDGSTWEIWLKDDATFDYEALKGRTETGVITLSITVTATDGGGLLTRGVFSVKLMDADTDDDPKPTTPPDAARCSGSRSSGPGRRCRRQR